MKKPYSHLKHAPFSVCPNAMLIPVTKLHYTTDNIALFNSIYFYMKSRKGWSTIKRTPSGGISNRVAPSELFNRWDFQKKDVWMEITIIESTGMWRIQMSPGKPKDSPILSGRQAYFMFEAFIKKWGIELSNYAIEKGETIHRSIEKPLIWLEHENLYKDRTFKEVHHIDYHSSYPAGLVNTHPEFSEAINFLYDRRHQKPEYKDLLNFTIGFLHSRWCGYKYAQLAKDAIADSNKRVMDLARKVQRAGRTILLFNTDGFWYQGKVYHGEGEGSKLGQWSNDHQNCIFRAKSSGAYEFIENEEYHPVLRGFTKLDEVKPRETWEWGDIYQDNAIVKQFDFNEEEGIYEL